MIRSPRDRACQNHRLKLRAVGADIMDEKVPHAALLELLTDHDAGTLMHL